MNFAELLKMRDFPTGGRRIICVRHTLTGEPQNLIDCVRGNREVFAKWQSVQGAKSKGRKIIGCDFVMSFCKVDGDRARFIGVYRNESGNTPNALDVDRLPEHLADAYREKIRKEKSEGETVDRFFFRLPKVENTFADLEGRVIVDWHGIPEWVEEYNPNAPRTISEITRESVAPFCDQ